MLAARAALAVLAALAALAGVAVACRPGDAGYPVELAAGRQLLEQREYDRALAHLDRLRRRYPGELEPYVLLARAAERLGRPDEAIPALEERAARGGAGAHLLHDLLGGLLDRAGRRADAEAQYRTALRLEAGYAPAYLRLSRLLTRAGSVKEAVEIAAGAVRRFPTDPRLRAWYGDLLLKRGRWAEAERELRRAVALDAADAYPYYTLGLLYLLTGRLDAARAELEAATRLLPGAHEGWYQLANVCDRQGDLAARDRALARFAAVYRPSLEREE